jgi:DNA repair protein SbcC/Rad50
MRPLRLMLDGFGTYRHETEADFSDVDFFALIGPTGSGKSTLIDGLCFALYGTVPRWGKENAIGYALAPSANSCRVCLVFELAGDRYAAVRALTRDKKGQVHTTAARLERLDASVPASAPLAELLEASAEQLASGPDEVKARVQELLGLTYEHFTQSVLLPQGSFSEFLRATSANRQRLLVELLAFGVYKEIGQRARDRAQRAEDRLQAAQRARDELAGATREAEAAATARLAGLTALAAAVDERLAALTGLGQRADQALRQASEARAESGLLTALRTPPGVPGLAQRIAAADAMAAAGRKRRADAEKLAEDAAAARATLPDKSRIERALAAHADRRELESVLERQRAALAARQAAEATLAQDVQQAERQLELAQAALQAAERAHAAAGLAEGLHVGDDCPVCRQRVAALPRHAAPADLAAARKAVGAADKAHRAAGTAHTTAAKAEAAARSAADATRQRLDAVGSALAGVPAEAAAAEQLAAIEKADEAAARTSRESSARRTELAAADAARAALGQDEQAAWTELGAARDKLVGLGAPAIGAAAVGATAVGAAAVEAAAVGAAGRADLAAAWAQLGTWAAAEQAQRSRRQPQLDAAATDLRREAAAAADALASLLAEHGIAGVAEPSRAPALVAGHRARAEADLQKLHGDRRHVARLDQQIAAHREEAQVAGMLGQLLRATSFERWLCSEALDSLVTEASATLMELSGGQYELDRDERNDLVVIDYEDAGARRPVHTLSGGETFQASLALALALSRQVIGLSAGMRDLNSVFLDEGFGTLDEDTLETVAATLERLAADKDRMVGVITHVATLADRVPVRFVVSRAGGTSTLRKERA